MSETRKRFYCSPRWKKNKAKETITVYPHSLITTGNGLVNVILLSVIHMRNAVLTHLPEAPTFTSGFARASAGVAASGNVLIYEADSGLAWWARWSEGPGSHWPAVHCSGWRMGGNSKGPPPPPPTNFLPIFLFLFVCVCDSRSSFLSHTPVPPHSLLRSPDENSTNQQRINRDSDNTTSNSPFTATGARRGPSSPDCSAYTSGSCMWRRITMSVFFMCVYLCWTLVCLLFLNERRLCCLGQHYVMLDQKKEKPADDHQWLWFLFHVF